MPNPTPPNEKPSHNSPFIIHNSALVPVYYFRGALPPLFELAEDYTGWLVCLSLSQDGHSCLLPLAWEQKQQTEDDLRPFHHPPLPTFTSSAVDSEAVSLTLRSLQ
ncbi:MAG: hypothetical protein KAG66_23260, partial [Methylococcales bacterium]|nr:hypothetical protein [Methylococcales bacterium]